MNFNDLTIFIGLYEYGSINKCASHLGYAQSNVSSRLRILEEEIGVKLFNRSFKGITPTETGEKFYHFSINTLSELNNFIQLKESSHNKILISEILLNSDINSEKEINIGESNIDIKKTCEIPKFAEIGNYDDIICFQMLDNARNYLVEIKNMKVAFICSKHLSERKKFLIVNKDKYCPLRKKTLERAQKSDHIIEVDSLENIISLVKEGQGIALLPEYLIEKEGLIMYSRCESINYYHYYKE